MNLLESIRMAFESISAAKLRSGLTMLGVVIGVACMQLMVAMIAGIQKDIMEDLSALGANSVYVFGQEEDKDEIAESEWRGHSNGLREADVEALEKLPGVAEARPLAQGMGGEFAYGDEKFGGQLSGVTPKELKPGVTDLTAGRFIVWPDVEATAKICVLGSRVTDELFGEDDAIGKVITINGSSYEVVGTLKSRGGQGPGSDEDRTVYIPITTAQRRIIGSDDLPMIVVEGEEGVNLEDLMARIKLEMKSLHGNVEDFDVISQKAILEAITGILRNFTLLFGGIGGLSLLVGGIGIMNIMLVTVTERTREIGIRKAVGARSWDILIQFIIESVVLAGFGGAIGVGFSLLVAQVLNKAFAESPSNLQFYVPIWAILVGFGVAFTVGLLSGIGPAIRASKLDPIEALRFESGRPAGRPQESGAGVPAGDDVGATGRSPAGSPAVHGSRCVR